jgi:predicted PurR-regulated permease PerM
MPAQSRIPWRSPDVLRATAIVAGVYIALHLLWSAHEVFFLAFIGVFFGLTLSSAADRLERARIPRALGAPLVLILVILSVAGLVFLAAPQVTSQAKEVREQVPQVVSDVRGWIEKQAGGVSRMLQDTTTQKKREAAPGNTARGKEADKIAELTPTSRTVGHAFFTVFSSTLSALGGIILVIFITVFVAIDPRLYHDGLMHLFPHRHRARAGEVLSAMAFSLRRWLATQLIAMVAIGTVTTGVLLLLEVRGAFALGVIAGLLEFIPFVGPIAASVPAIAMGLLDSPAKALYVGLAFTAIQQTEGHLLIPLLMKGSLRLPPVLTLLTQALMATVFGLLGLLIAVPMLSAVMAAVKMLYVVDVVGDEIEVPGEAEGEASG